MVKPLLEWYDQNKRQLPWRDQGKAYYTWVSEIMLQQTRVEAVKPYFSRFIKELPDVQSLAACPPERLMKLWEGLGYYSRARNMQTAARQIMDIFGGQIPLSYEKLLTLKGIGSYTAAAIASIAGGQCVPAVDGNVLRVVARLNQDPEDVTGQAAKKKAMLLLSGIIPAKAAGDFNQAMMELGALICLPHGQPLCQDCPVRLNCRSWASGRQTDFPVRPKAKERKQEHRTLVFVQDDEATLLQRRPLKGLLAGLYEPLNLEGERDEKELAAMIGQMGLELLQIESLPASRHIFTHKEWQMTAYLARVLSLDSLTKDSPASLAEKSRFVAAPFRQAQYPLPSAFKAYRHVL
ncbi:MAG: A/G-specific adenine glycosylase [Blautia sp.]|nr:A/G-specific adenine glycosylase [Blautia sp.]